MQTKHDFLLMSNQPFIQLKIIGQEDQKAGR